MSDFGYGIQVELKKPFSVIRETLERIGIVNHKTKEVFPSCYLLHKREKYYIIHFKNLLKVDGKKVDNFDFEDSRREKSIAMLLEKWGLVDIKDRTEVDVEPMFIFVLPWDKRDEYNIIHKYSIGNKKFEK